VSFLSKSNFIGLTLTLGSHQADLLFFLDLELISLSKAPRFFDLVEEAGLASFGNCDDFFALAKLLAFLAAIDCLAVDSLSSSRDICNLFFLLERPSNFPRFGALGSATLISFVTIE
jgi:hypothetical protein